MARFVRRSRRELAAQKAKLRKSRMRRDQQSHGAPTHPDPAKKTLRTKLTLVAMNVYTRSATRPRGTQRGGHVALQRAVISIEGSCLSCADLHLT